MTLKVLLAALSVVLCSAKLAIVSLEPHKDSLDAHHTAFYKLSGGFVARRGQSFDLIVKVDGGDIDVNAAVVSMSNKAEAVSQQVSFKVSLKRKKNDYLLSIDSSVVTPVGKFENIVITLEVNGEHVEYEYPHPFYLVFNAWNKEETIYLPTDEMRQEYILNEYGNVYQGSLKDHSNQVWHYGQSNQVTLDAAFHLLKKMGDEVATNPVKVMQTMSAHQGMIRNPKGDGQTIAVGDYDALLEGNWDMWPTDDTNAPERWNSVVAILTRWQETKMPAKYGQCWVFGALQNGLMRSIGIGSRHISAFGAMVDASNKKDKDKKFHHVIDNYYDIDGNSISTDGMAWNFHSWNQVYLHRTQSKWSGWQNLDGTPSGNGTTVGPAPVKGVKALDESYPFNVTFEISTVHATQRTFLVKCEPNHTKADKMKGCEKLSQVKYDPTGVHLVTSSKTLKNGTLAMDNLTDELVDPSLDAFIPFDDEDITARRMQAKGSGDSIVVIKPTTYNITVADDIEGTIEIESATFAEGDLIQLNMAFTIETYDAVEKEKISSSSERVLVKAGKVSIPWTLDSSAYLQKDMSNVYVRLVVTASSSDGRYFFDSTVFDIDSPSIQLIAPDNANTGEDSLPFKAAFINPFDFDLSNVCVNLYSYDLSFEGHSPSETKVSKCVDLKAREVLKFSTKLVAPAADVSYNLLATVDGDYLPTVTSHVVFSAVQGSTSDNGFAIAAAIAVVSIAAIVAGILLFGRLRRRVDGAWPQTRGAQQQLTGGEA